MLNVYIVRGNRKIRQCDKNPFEWYYHGKVIPVRMG